MPSTRSERRKITSFQNRTRKKMLIFFATYWFILPDIPPLRKKRVFTVQSILILAEESKNIGDFLLSRICRPLG